MLREKRRRKERRLGLAFSAMSFSGAVSSSAKTCVRSAERHQDAGVTRDHVLQRRESTRGGETAVFKTEIMTRGLLG